MTLFEAEGLHKSFGGLEAVKEVGFTLRHGELMALIGPNGAGKTTCFNCLNGQIRPDRGTIRLEGRTLRRLTPVRAARLGMARTFQITRAFGSLSVLENVQLALLAHARRTFRMWTPTRKLVRDEALQLLGQVGMADQAERACAILAYGDLKRVELAVALAGAPRILLMDEPTAGMAPRERQELMALTRDLVRARGLAVLFTEHDMDVVFAHADRIMVMNRGELIAEGPPATVRRDPRVREVYLGDGSEVPVD